MKKVTLFLFSLVLAGVAVYASTVVQPAKADSGPLAKCKMDGYINNVQDCQSVGDIGWYVTTKGDYSNIYCAKVVNATTANQCIYMTYNANGTPQQYCRVNVNNKVIPMRCAKIKSAPHYYKTVTGDSKVIYCVNQTKPYATVCQYSTPKLSNLDVE